MQNNFMFEKIISIFNENTNLFFDLVKIKSVFNENTNQFYVWKKKIRSEKYKSIFELKKSNLKNKDQFLS